jgi:hypothetical protein
LLPTRCFRYLSLCGRRSAAPVRSAMPMKRKYFSVWAGLFCLCARAEPAFSQSPEERAGARAAADQGFDALERGEWAVALDLFDRAESLVHSPVHVLYQARSQAKLNRLIEAQEAYLRVLREPLPAGAPAVTQAARDDAQRELALLEPQIPFVSVSVAGTNGSEAIEILQDGRALPPALIGVERPLNPGEHSWRARSGSRQSETERRLVQTGTRSTVTLRLPEAEIELVPPREPMSGADAVRSAGLSEAVAPVGSHGPSAWVYVGFGVAAAGLGVGTAFLLQKGNIEERIRNSCDPTGCYATPVNLDRKADADRAGLISAVGFISAGVGSSSALVLWWLLPGADAAPRVDAAGTAHAPRLRPWVGWGSAGVTGSF